MEELLLGRFLAGDELDIIDQQYVDRAVFFTERLCGVRADGVDHVVGEFLGGDIQHIQPALVAGVADGMKQVRLAKSDTPVQEQGVIGTRRFFRHRQAGGVGQAVPRADDKRIEVITRVQADVARNLHGSTASLGLGGARLLRFNLPFIA